MFQNQKRTASSPDEMPFRLICAPLPYLPCIFKANMHISQANLFEAEWCPVGHLRADIIALPHRLHRTFSKGFCPHLLLNREEVRMWLTAGTLGPDAEFKAGCATVHPRELVGKFFNAQCLCFFLCKQEDSSTSLGCWRIKGLNTYKMLRIVPCTH